MNEFCGLQDKIIDLPISRPRKDCVMAPVMSAVSTVPDTIKKYDTAVKV